MGRKICTAGVVGSISFMVLDQDKNGVVSSIRDDNEEIVARHADVEQATQWTERTLKELIGRRYENY